MLMVYCIHYTIHHNVFREHLIDVLPLKYFLWAYTKSLVYRDKPALEASITASCSRATGRYAGTHTTNSVLYLQRSRGERLNENSILCVVFENKNYK